MKQHANNNYTISNLLDKPWFQGKYANVVVEFITVSKRIFSLVKLTAVFNLTRIEKKPIIFLAKVVIVLKQAITD